MAGYSGTPLPIKLGIKPGHRVLLDAVPDTIALAPLPAGVTVHRRAGRASRVGRPGAEPYDVIIACTPDLATLHRRYGPLKDRMRANGALWICWPKRSSGVSTDLSENAIRDHALANGLVDVKVCAVDRTWSGLKLVYRLVDR